MTDSELIDKVKVRMSQLEITQVELSAACIISQPHLSKVLSKKIKLAQKTKSALTSWLSLADAAETASPADLMQKIAQKLEKQKPHKIMQFMQFLNTLDRLLME
jgi:predicted XRE-type DNA-binding protein